MEEYAGGFVLRVIRTVRKEGIEAKRLTSFKVIPRLRARSGISGLQDLQCVWSGPGEFVRIDRISAASRYGLN